MSAKRGRKPALTHNEVLAIEWACMNGYNPYALARELQGDISADLMALIVQGVETAGGTTMEAFETLKLFIMGDASVSRTTISTVLREKYQAAA